MFKIRLVNNLLIKIKFHPLHNQSIISINIWKFKILGNATLIIIKIFNNLKKKFKVLIYYKKSINIYLINI
jgi:hypothetical protein